METTGAQKMFCKKEEEGAESEGRDELPSSNGSPFLHVIL